MKEFAKKLRIYVATYNIKKKDFAVAVGVTPETISKWLSGKYKPQRLHAIAIDTETKGAVNMFDMGY